MVELEKIIQTLGDVFDGSPWHGPNVRKIFKLDPALKDKRSPNGHTIVELVGHMTSWRMFVLRRIEGDQTFEVTDEMNFPSSSDWSKALEALEKTQIELIQALQTFDPGKLEDFVPGRKYSYRKMIEGIVHHDLYHLGQIIMISK